MPNPVRQLGAVIALIALCAPGLRSQTARPLDGPPAPVAPEVITRAANGQATIRAIKLSAPLTLDGVPHQIVGIAPDRFGGHMGFQGGQLFLPLERHPGLRVAPASTLRDVPSPSIAMRCAFHLPCNAAGKNRPRPCRDPRPQSKGTRPSRGMSVPAYCWSQLRKSPEVLLTLQQR